MMNRTFSTYLDAVRFVAALTVLFSHFAYERISGGAHLWVRELNLGSDAVVIFFVLSGLVIAYTAEEKDADAGRYLFNRATRIYSVALPALLLTFALDRLGASINPAAYDGWWYAEAPLATLLWHGLTFSSEWHIPGTRLGTNGPYWSLSYEVAYYLIFAAALFLSGAKRILVLAALAVIAGLKVLLLLPVWYLGVATWQMIRRGRMPTSARACAMMLILPPVIYAACLWAGVPAMLFQASAALAGVDPDVLRKVLGFSDECVWNFVLGVLVAVHLAGAAGLSRRRLPRDDVKVPVASIRWLAGASFSIYLVHYPLLQFLDAVLPAEMASGSRQGLILAATLAACFVFAQAFERPLGHFRALLQSLPARVPPLAGRRAG
ncbi:acyltransferase [Nitratireductor mangrovi]|uniref:Acyltransferase n=1 Tax=Nitratireductor mangrovi TaxID=2599600 RepID=A0A5B8KWN1_9HYPH|nr:acyltransferase [Nitratireductor mangrovi]QDY99929.1 acyltransferase [Nitratireductor mangrovi]